MTDQTSPQPSNFCRDCAHLIGKRDYKADAANWKCGAPQNKLAATDLVTGIPDYKYATCYKARENEWLEKKLEGELILLSCGLVGLWFVEYKKPDYSNKPSPQPRINLQQAAADVNIMLDELENL